MYRLKGGSSHSHPMRSRSVVGLTENAAAALTDSHYLDDLQNALQKASVSSLHRRLAERKVNRPPTKFHQWTSPNQHNLIDRLKTAIRLCDQCGPRPAPRRQPRRSRRWPPRAHWPPKPTDDRKRAPIPSIALLPVAVARPTLPIFHQDRSSNT